MTLTNTELKKVLVVEKVLDGHMTNEEGAALLGLSVRQVQRLKKRYQVGNAGGIAHGNRGRKPVHALSAEIKDRVAELYTQKYQGSNSCHFAELLAEHEGIELSGVSTRRILLTKGLKSAKQRRRSKVHQPRKRRSQVGMLWQIDATPYAWLEDRAPVFALHAAIDDATGIVTGAVFMPTECREGYSLVMMQGIKKQGIPLGLYSDRHTIFRSPNEKLTLEQQLAGMTKPLSHFGKAMHELGIEHIKAVTPQAKGRIERLWVTLQDRLVIELRLLGVSTIEEANKALPKLIAKHNKQFAVAPVSADSAYRKLGKDVRLEHVFTTREHRKLGTGRTLSYGGRIYTFAKAVPGHWDAKSVVEVRETLSGALLIWHNGEALMLKETTKAVRQAEKKPNKKAGIAQPRKPAADHPWKRTYQVHQKQIQNTTMQGRNQAT
uniref:ISNCY family transposase n=1 Tax=Paenibacillus lycopersici TaxID=2704462 RepID=UPI00384D91BF